MDPVTIVYGILLVVGIALMGVGVYAVFKLTVQGKTVVELFGQKLETPIPGIVMLFLGLVLAVWAVQQFAGTQQVRITGACLYIEDTGRFSGQYNVRCPVTIPLAGIIDVSSGTGTITYRFVRREGIDGAEIPGQRQVVSVSGPQAVRVADELTVNFPEGDSFYSIFLQVDEPGSQRSSPVEVTIRCDPSLPPAPPIPPPVRPEPPC